MLYSKRSEVDRGQSSAPTLGPEIRAALIVSYLAVLPVIPGPESLWALSDTLEVLAEAQALKPDLKAVIVINRSEFTMISNIS